jgi:catechol 2,3-dioxygenase-like lactoylglutathione lyase family enzyme
MGRGGALDHVGLSVGDLEAMRDWYCRALGLRAAGEFSIQALGLRGVFVLGEGGLAIELLERAGSVAGPQAQDQPTALLTRGFGHICLRVPDVDAAHRDLLEAGAEERMSPRESPESGVRMSFVADPEGNFIELIDREGPLQ